jgi:hypothetical protein
LLTFAIFISTCVAAALLLLLVIRFLLALDSDLKATSKRVEHISPNGLWPRPERHDSDIASTLIRAIPSRHAAHTEFPIAVVRK